MTHSRICGAPAPVGFQFNRRRGLYNGPQRRQPDFWLPLGDAGNGAVDLSLLKGAGSETYTRATSAASRLSTGMWKLDVASGTARYHYHEYSPGVISQGGYLAEAAATQILTAPRDMTNAAWVAGATATVAQDGTGIDGAANSCSRITGGAVEATNTVLQTITAAASSRTYSYFIKRVTGTGAIGITQDGVTFTDISAQLSSASFVQVQLNASQLNAVIGVRVSVDGDVVLVDCNQFESGAAATTPIPAAGTRNQDSLLFPFVGNALSSLGSVYAEVALLAIYGRNQIIVGSGGGSDALLWVGSSDVSTVTRVRDGTTSVAKTGLSDLTTGIRKRASRWGDLTMRVTGDGAEPASTAFDGAMATTALGIGVEGDGSGSLWGGTIANVMLWMLDNDLRRLTA